MLKVNEIFESIQGEGRHAGRPALFIRLSGCNLACSWCDTKYHTEGREMSERDLAAEIEKSSQKIVIWTGGEPTLQLNQIKEVILLTHKKHHLETNGTYQDFDDLAIFDYICFSPKTKEVARELSRSIPLDTSFSDIKVVTDLKDTGTDMLAFATILMPLSTFNHFKDQAIKERVWNYCRDHGIRYSPRLHIALYGQKRGI